MTTAELDELTLAHGGHRRREDGMCATEGRRLDGTFAPHPLAARLASRLEPTADGCLEWRGTTCAKGYGSIRDGSRMVKAHRVAWELAHGEIPVGQNVLHRCDNPPCCNPDHLFLGTVEDNNRDRDRKGRSDIVEAVRAAAEARKRIVYCPSGHAYDERNTGVRASGARWCRACARERERTRRAARRGPR